MNKFELYYPVRPMWINQQFGNPNAKYKTVGIPSGKHNGIDFYADDGDKIMAAHDGEVTYAGEDGASGLLVVIRTLEKFPYEGKQVYFKTLYCHIKKNSFKVKPGDIVKAGQVIALADNTGFSTGSHLHFGLKPVRRGEKSWQWYNLKQDNGYNGAIDPNPYFTGFYADDRSKVDAILAALLAAGAELKRMLYGGSTGK
jgi:murein DD-endopeptidase MepM/ murein hydrolase activator NlpD